VISKFSSDCVAGAVESFADRGVYIRSRLSDFARKRSDLFKLASELELAAPDTELPRLLKDGTIFRLSGVRNSTLLNRIYLNALDLMYLWMRQPRAPQVIGKVLEKASYEERRLFEAMQHQLSHEEEVTRLLDSGILGPSSRALSFYTHAWKLYLSELEALNLGKKAENSEKS
jgi:hypothetical protein